MFIASTFSLTVAVFVGCFFAVFAYDLCDLLLSRLLRLLRRSKRSYNLRSQVDPDSYYDPIPDPWQKSEWESFKSYLIFFSVVVGVGLLFVVVWLLLPFPSSGIGPG